MCSHLLTIIMSIIVEKIILTNLIYPPGHLRSVEKFVQIAPMGDYYSMKNCLIHLKVTYYIYFLMGSLGLSFEHGPSLINQLGPPPGLKEYPPFLSFLVFTKVFVDYMLGF